mmetsp:Transcript_37352/g.97922  ORF Transcript_37352/g.97922 Transcript_37352/m.97922 type:complete len:245 (-) Transcript_37352:191-925(-)
MAFYCTRWGGTGCRCGRLRRHSIATSRSEARHPLPPHERLHRPGAPRAWPSPTHGTMRSTASVDEAAPGAQSKTRFFTAATTSAYTSSTPRFALISSTRLLARYRSITGRVSLTYVWNRFCSTATLSSARLAPSAASRARCSTLSVHCSMSHSSTRTIFTSAASPTTWSQWKQLSSLRGKPSTRKNFFPFSASCLLIAACSSAVVISPGTISPLAMMSWMRWAVAVPDLRSARRRSPAERCTKP